MDLETNFFLPELNDFIVGPAVIVGVNDSGYDVQLSMEEVELFKVLPTPFGTPMLIMED